VNLVEGGVSEVEGRKQRLVCVLCPGDLEHAGGIGRMLGYLFEAWRLEDRPPPVRLIDTRGPRHIVFAPLYFAWALLQITGLALRGRVALLHVNLASRGSALRKLVVTGLARSLRVPVVIHLHGAQFDIFFRSLPAPGRGAMRWMFRRASRIIVLGEAWRDFVISEIGVPGDKVEIIYNGVPEPKSVRAKRPSSAPLEILFLGRLGARKGVPELLKSLSAPEVTRQSWRATLAGDGEVDFFRAEVERLGLSDRIRLTGWLDQRKVSELLGEADIFVLPSYQEGLPVAVLEALASKVAVIATPVGALPEILTNEESALLVSPGNVDELTRALDRLLADAALRSRIAAKGHEIFDQHFNVSRVARSFSEVYAAVGKLA
jgi:glycosyltransferase involved in cell wall biosynthesis